MGRAKAPSQGALRDAPKPGAPKPGAPKPRAARAKRPPSDDPRAPVGTLPGIGPTLADKLAARGLATVEDMLWWLPRRYDDARGARTLAEVWAMDEGERATFAAEVISARMVFVRGRRWAEVRLMQVEGTPIARAVVRWFNVFAGIEKRMPAGSRVVLSGVVKKKAGQVSFANPDILGIFVGGAEDAAATEAAPTAASDGMPAAILARYSEIAGVPSAKLRVACAAAVERCAARVDDGLSAVARAGEALPTLAESLARLHAPPADITADELAALNRADSPWHRRLIFGELVMLGVAIAQRRRAQRQIAAVACPRIELEAIAQALPFALTGAQRRVIDEVAGDLAQATPMNRLLQGDVGAGKTCVAFAAALQVARAGRQVVMMAPTELLAEQHVETWRGWAKASGLRVALLTASTMKVARAAIVEFAASGELDVIIGTHALLDDALAFRALGLAIIDEQHRFGVAQRAKLRERGAPHLLVMTATPIPRTLALTAYGDLDISLLDELPPGRVAPTTELRSGARGRSAASSLLAARIATGERAYVVCAKIAPDDDDIEDGDKLVDAVTMAAELAAELPGARIGVVHGRLNADDRDRAMRAFKAGALDVLVATTVIEVGVDVPAATVMIIHDADRFGLAQLHQLRGRVGRGGGDARCLLLTRGSTTEEADARLATLVESSDGFAIAEADLALRGPGELLGARQAGAPRRMFGNLAQHMALLVEARRVADDVVARDPALDEPQHAGLRRAIARRTSLDDASRNSAAFGEEAG